MNWPDVWQPWQVTVFGGVCYILGLFTSAVMVIFGFMRAANRDQGGGR